MYFEKHIFVCTNQRPDEKRCCANQEAGACHYLKTQIKSRGLAGRNRVRVSQSGCLGRCDEGPVAVVYPEGHWYTYQNQSDLDEIIEQDLINGKKVVRLSLPD